MSDEPKMRTLHFAQRIPQPPDALGRQAVVVVPGSTRRDVYAGEIAAAMAASFDWVIYPDQVAAKVKTLVERAVIIANALDDEVAAETAREMAAAALAAPKAE